jgi:adenine-specific DNA-methyltransferase
MIQNINTQNDDVTINSKQIAVLKEHFSSCFKSDGSFDITRFQEEIKDKADVVHEGYELKFLGKSYAKLLASTDTTTILQPNEAHNNLPENAISENIYISGDNLDGLKHLLKSYQNSIKCIYIDPPYNTGSDGFVYQDNFNYTLENLQEKLNVTEDEANRILDLTKRGSASHSAWLLFMYSRLLLARDVLTDDGVIFISIDDNEQANLKLLCDDAFGEENFVGQFIVNSSPSGIDYGHMGKTNDYALFYTKNTLQAKTNQLEEVEKEFKFQDKDGGFNLYPLYNGNSSFNDRTRPNLLYPFYVNPIKNSNDQFHEISLTKTVDWIEVYPVIGLKDSIQRVWRWGRIKSAKYLNDEIVGLYNRDGEYRIMQKSRLTSKVIRSLQLDNEVSSRRGTLEIESLFGKKVFSYPKPSNYIKRLITVGTDQDSTVLDFFSGSASTAHAVMQLNAEDGGNRKFIAVQLPEVLHADDASQNIAYEFLQENNLPTTLDYIGMERIKRASAKIKAEQIEKTKAKAEDLFEEVMKQELDLGFKHYTLVEPNQNTLDKLETFDKAGLLADTTILDDFGKPTVLATWLNADGYGLTATAQAIDLAGYTAYYYRKHIYLIDGGFTLESMKALLSQYDSQGAFNPENVVLFGYSFPDWSISEMIDKNLRILNDSEKNLKINYAVRY